MIGVHIARRRPAAAKPFARILSMGLALVLGGCSSIPMTPRVVSPTLDARAVSETVSSHAQLMAALQVDAGEMGFASSDWYEVTLAGFNYVDDQCTVYFDSLFAFNRNVSAVKSGLSAFNQTAAAIMQITDTADVTMAVIAQAFGLAGSMTDVVAGTFLYELPPANTYRFVQKNMSEYKGAVSTHRRDIDGRASAYSAIRGYLNLCLPVTIEGQLIDRISDSAPQSKAGSTGTNVEIDVRPSASVLDSAESRMPIIVEAPATQPGRNAYERQVSPGQWMQVQVAICVQPDGDPGDATHAAMAEFFEGYGTPDPELTARGIGPLQMDILRKAIREANGRTCAQRGEGFTARTAGQLVR